MGAGKEAYREAARRALDESVVQTSTPGALVSWAEDAGMVAVLEEESVAFLDRKLTIQAELSIDVEQPEQVLVRPDLERTIVVGLAGVGVFSRDGKRLAWHDLADAPSAYEGGKHAISKSGRFVWYASGGVTLLETETGKIVGRKGLGHFFTGPASLFAWPQGDLVIVCCPMDYRAAILAFDGRRLESEPLELPEEQVLGFDGSGDHLLTWNDPEELVVRSFPALDVVGRAPLGEWAIPIAHDGTTILAGRTAVEFEIGPVRLGAPEFTARFGEAMPEPAGGVSLDANHLLLSHFDNTVRIWERVPSTEEAAPQGVGAPLRPKRSRKR
jgi:hypothetical protein